MIPATMRLSIAIHCIVGATCDEAMDRACAIDDQGGATGTSTTGSSASSEQRLFGSVDEVAAA